MTEASAPAHGARVDSRALWGPRALAVGLLASSGWVVFTATRLPESGGYTAVGPRFFPMVVGIGLLVLSLVFLVQTTVRPDRDLAEKVAGEAQATHWWTVILLVLGLAVYILALDTAGYAVATTVLFPGMTWLFGSRQIGRNVVIGLVLGVGIYLTFTNFLGVRLSPGPFLW